MNERPQSGRVSTIARGVAVKARKNDSVVEELLHASRDERFKVIGDCYDQCS